MNMEIFFNRLRTANHIFTNGRLSQPQVDGIEPIILTCQHLGITNPHYVAYILATVYHETGSYMFPVKETVFASHTDKSPSDATVIKRLDRAYAAGQLKWVTTPYWRTGWFGRGGIQITHRENYKKMGDRLGVDLVGNPSLALNPHVSASIAIVGMVEGMFRRDSNGPIALTRFTFPGALHNPVSTNPRRIINGQDGTDVTVARYHTAFHSALIAAGYGTGPSPAPAPVPAPQPTPDPIPPATTRTPEQIIMEIRSLLDELGKL